MLTSIKKNAQKQPVLSDKELLLHNLLVDLLTIIKLQGYQFTTVTPRTHEHFYSRAHTQGNNLRDIFGWNLPFSFDAISPAVKAIMIEAGIIEPCEELWRSKLRISSLGKDVFLHSEFPTTKQDAVFFGPDTYRFARFIRHSLEKNHAEFIQKFFRKPLRILDIGCGTGAGGIAAVRALPKHQSYQLTMNDINQTALDLTKINAQVAGVDVQLVKGNILDGLDGKFDLIIVNPPYMQDDSGRAYRDGGENLGLDLGLRIFNIAYEHLAPAGKLILYTGVAMTNASDPFLTTIAPLLSTKDCTWCYEEIDPDIFGEELERPLYAKAYRIAAVGLEVTLRD